MKWCKDGDVHRLQQPLGKQYSYGKGISKMTLPDY
mgnify:CR=1 FL=1